MNVAMVVRPYAPGRHGGDLVQAEMTARELSKKGVRVTISSGEDIARADIVHAFNMQTPDWTLGQITRASRYGKPVVLSPVYWNSLHLVAGALTILPSIAPFLPRALEKGRRMQNLGGRTFPLVPLGHRGKQREALRRSGMILPNSRAEADLLLAEFPELSARTDCLRVVPNGVDFEAFEGEEGAPPWEEGLPEPGCYALCVSRIDFRKNQLRLIEAVEALGMPLVCVGDPVLASPLHAAYYDACRARGTCVTFLPHTNPRNLWPLYANCAVHCVPSYFETPGLSNLEAALAGARIITTPYGSTREYFGDLARYCNPGSVGSIRRAIERSLESPASDDLRDLVRQRYTWRRAAAITLEVYTRILEEPRRDPV